MTVNVCNLLQNWAPGHSSTKNVRAQRSRLAQPSLSNLKLKDKAPGVRKVCAEKYDATQARKKWKRRTGGVPELLKNLGVDDLRKVEEISRTPGRSRVLANEKLQEIRDQEELTSESKNCAKTDAVIPEKRKRGRPLASTKKAHIELIKSKFDFTRKTDKNGIEFWRDPTRPYRFFAKCNICEKTISRTRLENHLNAHKRQAETAKLRPFQCPICHVGMTSRFNLRRHFELHLENNPFVCTNPGCTHKAQSEDHLTRHMGLHYDRRVTCEKCGASYRSDARAVKSHKFICDRTGFKRRKPAEMQARLQRAHALDTPGTFVKEEAHNQSTLESVHITDKIIETEDGPIHVKGEHLTPIPEREVQSPEISIVTHPTQKLTETKREFPKCQEDLLQLILHDPVYQRLVEERPEVATDFVGHIFYTSKATKTFACSKCKAVFCRFWSLSNHEKKCFGGDKSQDATSEPAGSLDDTEKKLLCGQCGFQYTTQEELRRHLKTAENHGPNSRYICQYPSCGLPFFSKKRLQSHSNREHVLEKKHKCSECNSAFSKREGLRMHSRRVHNGGAGIGFTCVQCNTTFETWQLLRRHKKMNHYSKETYPRCTCQLCEDVFAGKHALVRHIRLVHTKTLKVGKKKKQVIQGGKVKEITVRHFYNPHFDSERPQREEITRSKQNSVDNESIDEGGAETCILGF